MTIQTSPTSDSDDNEGEPIMVAQYYHTNTGTGRPEEVTQVINEYMSKENHRLDQLETGDEPRDQPLLLCLRTLYSKITIVHLPNDFETWMIDLVRIPEYGTRSSHHRHIDNSIWGASTITRKTT